MERFYCIRWHSAVAITHSFAVINGDTPIDMCITAWWKTVEKCLICNRILFTITQLISLCCCNMGFNFFPLCLVCIWHKVTIYKNSLWWCVALTAYGILCTSRSFVIIWDIVSLFSDNWPWCFHSSAHGGRTRHILFGLVSIWPKSISAPENYVKIMVSFNYLRKLKIELN